ncbi:MAG: hypothetical protein DHS20C05_07900 [Hyphococcus sp.]|nr:MAG: hypothetical protein DHS20C05_07900 [Marinicaulis sp.]
MSVNHITRTQIIIRDQAVPLVARVNRRAKRLILKVDPIAGEILVTSPSKRAVPEAIAFAKERIDWIASQLDENLKARPFVEGMKAPFKGVSHTILRQGGPRAPIEVDLEYLPVIRVGGEAAHLNRRLVDWMKRQARSELSQRADHYCRVLGKERRAIRIGDTRTKWGSCTSDGALAFSWRLVMAPIEVLDYVAAHECVHLIHMNHSLAFWRKVNDLGVDARAAETWLNKNGSQLFSYGTPLRDGSPARL